VEIRKDGRNVRQQEAAARFCLAVVAAKGLNKVKTYFLLCFPSSVCQTNGLNYASARFHGWQTAHK
jgi:hypothetical protein